MSIGQHSKKGISSKQFTRIRTENADLENKQSIFGVALRFPLRHQ